MEKQPTTCKPDALVLLLKTRFIAGILPVCLLLMSIQSSPAGSGTWNLNPTSNDWNDDANWTPPTVPNGPNDWHLIDSKNKQVMWYDTVSYDWGWVDTSVDVQEDVPISESVSQEEISSEESYAESESFDTSGAEQKEVAAEEDTDEEVASDDDDKMEDASDQGEEMNDDDNGGNEDAGYNGEDKDGGDVGSGSAGTTSGNGSEN